MQPKSSLVQEGESGQQWDLNQEHAESPDHLELHEYMNLHVKIENDYIKDAEAPVTGERITF